MGRVATLTLTLAILATASLAQAEENRGSADYLVPLCRFWLDLVESDGDTLQPMGRVEQLRLAGAGICVGAVFGVLESLRSIKRVCPPTDMTNPALVQTMLSEIEKHPEKMKEDFVVRVRVAMVKSWPCRRKKDPDRVTQAASGEQH
jgi:hypothetical protein